MDVKDLNEILKIQLSFNYPYWKYVQVLIKIILYYLFKLIKLYNFTICYEH